MLFDDLVNSSLVSKSPLKEGFVKDRCYVVIDVGGDNFFGRYDLPPLTAHTLT
jgi:hypothetical protein